MIAQTRFLILIPFSFSCATTPTQRPDAKKTYSEICAQNDQLEEVTGSLWMKVQSKDANGQFPGVIKVKKNSLHLEVTNLVGGREALIQIQGAKYVVQHQSKRLAGRNHWGGIPLEWAIPLFMGKVPCSSHPENRVFWGENGDLIVQREIANATKDQEIFTYEFQDWSGKNWTKSVHWEMKSPKKPQSVHFDFSDPDDKTGWPKKWVAKSEHGEVQVRWKDWTPVTEQQVAPLP